MKKGLKRNPDEVKSLLRGHLPGSVDRLSFSLHKCRCISRHQASSCVRTLQRRIISVFTGLPGSHWKNVLITRSGRLTKKEGKTRDRKVHAKGGPERLTSAFSGALSTLNSRV